MRVATATASDRGDSFSLSVDVLSFARLFFSFFIISLVSSLYLFNSFSSFSSSILACWLVHGVWIYEQQRGNKKGH